VPLVLVLGHEGCGAVTAALGEMDDEAPELSRLLRAVRPALREVDPTLPFDERVHAGVEANVRHAVERLRGIIERERETHALPPGLRIAGGVYELDSGRVRLLE
jgi:carbonic anhydrase